MKIWVDADACPVIIKEILYKAAERTELQLILVANAFLRVPRSPFIRFIRVTKGPDKADNEIADNAGSEDLVITADIPLAARIVEQGGRALNPRGEVYTEDNIKERLSTRDFMESLRMNGVETSGPAALTAQDKQLFANKLDQLLTQYINKKNKG